MQTRDLREGRLMLARRRLDTANQALRTAHTTQLPDDGARADYIQRAQELVITIEQEVALLSNGLAREYPDADETFSSDVV